MVGLPQHYRNCLMTLTKIKKESQRLEKILNPALVEQKSAIYVPQRLFLTGGIGRHKERLASFEMALRDANIAVFNLVYVSSILPPQCTIVSKEEGTKALRGKEGGIVFCVMARQDTDEPGRQIASSIGIAIPHDKNRYGYLSEVHNYGESEQETGNYAEDLAAGMLATTLGIPFDVNANYDDRKQQYMLGGHIVNSSNMTRATLGQQGIWTTVISAAVLI